MSTSMSSSESTTNPFSGGSTGTTQPGTRTANSISVNTTRQTAALTSSTGIHSTALAGGIEGSQSGLDGATAGGPSTTANTPGSSVSSGWAGQVTAAVGMAMAAGLGAVAML